jgi:hypothetical protein
VLQYLANVPTNDDEWQQWSFANKTSHDAIRQAINGGITSVSLTAGGAKYTSAPAVSISGGGRGASAIATVSGGAVTGVTIKTPGFSYPQIGAAISFSGGGGSGAAATPVFGRNLGDFQIQPIPFFSFGTFLQNNQSLHTEMNGILGQQSGDLLDVDYKNSDQLRSWIATHYLEHYYAEGVTGVN